MVTAEGVEIAGPTVAVGAGVTRDTHPQPLSDLLDSRLRIIREISLALPADKVQKGRCYRRSGLLMGAAVQSRAGVALTGVDLDVLPPPPFRYL